MSGLTDILDTGLIVIYGDTDTFLIAPKYRRHMGWLNIVLTEGIIDELRKREREKNKKHDIE